MRIVLKAPAKVNLFLEVTGRRSDGYHDLETLFAKIELFDTLSMQPADKTSLRIAQRSPTRIPAGPGNLAARAVEAFRARFGGPGARMTLVKRIPAGAGLGGGSSDAAAALRGMARLAGRPVDGALRLIATDLGADVPFFLQDAACCVGRGIGERLTPVRLGSRPWLVVAYPGVGVSTPEAYRRLRLGKGRLTRVNHLDKLVKRIRRRAPLSSWTGLLFNRLEEPVSEICPETQRAREVFEAQGFRALLSGSGGCIFAPAADGPAARRLAAGLRRRERGWTVYATRVLG